MLEQVAAGLAGGAWAPILSGLTGVIGGVMRGFIDLKARRLEVDHEHRMAVLDINAEIRAREHELAMHEANLRRAEAESDMRLNEEREKVKGRITEKDLDALIASHSQDKSDPQMENIKSWVRIVLTVGSGIVVIILTIYVGYLVGGLRALGSKVLTQLFLVLVVTCVSLASLSFSWWFATRPTIRKWMEAVTR